MTLETNHGRVRQLTSTLVIALATLLSGIQASAQTARFDVDIIVSESFTSEGYVYSFRVTNSWSAPAGQFMLGFDLDESDANLEVAPITMRSPQGWQASIGGAEGNTGISIVWRTIARRDFDHAIPAFNPLGVAGLGGFEVVLPRPDPRYRTARATIIFFDTNHIVTDVAPEVPSADFTKPSVTITAPAGGSTVSGSVLVKANATDNIKILDVRFQLDGGELGAASSGGGESVSYELTWNTLTDPNGIHVLTAIARDAAGNTTTSAPVTVTVTNDQTPPTVNLSSPPPGAVLSGTVTLSASAQAVNAILGVYFQVDGSVLGSPVATAPFSKSWNTTTIANGSHVLTAAVLDAAGRVVASAPVSVTVSN